MKNHSERPTTDSPPCPRRSLGSWAVLEGLARESQDFSIKGAFATDSRRFKKLHTEACGILIDISKQAVTPEIVNQLTRLARECDLEGWRARMFGGEAINDSEGRAVLHTALRAPEGVPVTTGGRDVAAQIHETLGRMKAFSRTIRAEGRFRHIVNIGIGGSDLGPHMANEALKPFTAREIDVHYVSNVDAAHLGEALRVCDPQATLFIVTSKTFTTQETMTNALSAKAWLQEKLKREDVREHFVAVTQNIAKAEAFGVSGGRIFPMWDWVGGRYSLWSAVGLTLCLSLGFAHFRSMLDGAHAMDRHFLEAPLEENLPVLLALTGVWNRTFLGHSVLALLPYSQLLHKFPSFVQQLDMESNGKSVDRDGRRVSYPTGPIVFGEPGTNGQHAFYQLLHQGTTIVPCEFIAVGQSEYDFEGHQSKLLSNVIGQSKALMDGQADPDPQKRFEGNRPSTTLALKRLDPFTLGALIALYEHKIFTQGVIWNLNSFDQWGVELGKTIAGQVLKHLEPGGAPGRLSSDESDSSTLGLIEALRDTP